MYISVKFFCQDFLLKTTNLMTYAARDKNSLLNFLDENLVMWWENLNLRCESIIKIWWDIMRSSHWEQRTWTNKVRAFLLGESCYSFSVFDYKEDLIYTFLVRCFWRTTWQKTISSGSSPSSGRALHRWGSRTDQVAKQFSCFSDFGGDHLPLYREQEAADLLQDPLGDSQSALWLLLWRPHAQGWDSH